MPGIDEDAPGRVAVLTESILHSDENVSLMLLHKVDV